MEPRVRRSFITAMGDIKDRAQLSRLRDALRDRDINAAIQSLNIDPAGMADMRALVLETYAKSGQQTIQTGTWRFPNGQKAVVRWNSLSPRAEAYARGLSSTLVQGITDETISVVRETIADGYAFNRSTDRIARDLVGRIGKNGKRVGGVVGLDDQSARWTRNLRGYLTDDPSRALSMKLTARDKQFIRRIVSQGRTLTQSQIDGMLRRYENNLLLVRGRRIARTETKNAIEAGKIEAWRQGLEKTGIPEQFIIKKWIHTGRAAIDRIEHIAMNGDEVRGLETAHVLPSGAQMLHPHDATLGAGARDIVNCECREDYRIDILGLRRWQELQAG